MPTETQRLKDFSAIRQFVNQTLCEKDQLETNYFPLSERILVRRGRPCGVHFVLQGPRSLCLTAIWETDSNTILFYGSRGERFRRTQVVGPPRIEIETAAHASLAAGEQCPPAQADSAAAIAAYPHGDSTD